MSVLFEERKRGCSNAPDPFLAVLGAAHDWQPLEPERIRYLLYLLDCPAGLSCWTVLLDCPAGLSCWAYLLNITTPGAFTPPQNGKPTSVAQIREFA
jgi:hypothetical protein